MLDPRLQWLCSINQSLRRLGHDHHAAALQLRLPLDQPLDDWHSLRRLSCASSLIVSEGRAVHAILPARFRRRRSIRRGSRSSTP